jgi:membrane protease YdiL (CAAX protease family)
VIPDDGPAEPPYPAPLQAFVLALAAAVLRLWLAVPLLGGLGPRPAAIGIATLVAFGAVFAFAARRIADPPGESLGLLPAPRRAWLAVLLLLPALLLISELDNALQALVPALRGEQSEAAEATAGLLLEGTLVLVFVVPFVDEIFFRGVLQPGLVAALGRARGIALVAALDALAALSLFGPRGAVSTFAGASLLGLLRDRSGSLLPGLLLNALFGAVGVAAQAGAFGIPGFDDASAPHTPLGWLVLAGLSSGAGLAVCRSLQRVREES